MRLKIIGLTLLLTACGGKSAGTADTDVEAPAARGGSSASAGREAGGGGVPGSISAGGTATTPGGATSTSNAGAPTTDPGDCDLNDLGEGCVESCGIDPVNVFQRVCVAHRWQCPEGFVGLETCSTQSCARAQLSCCDGALGAIQSAPCVNGARLDCPEGTAALSPNAAACRPPHVVDCAELDGKPCSDDALECHNGERRGLNCACDSGADGSLIWSCWSVLR